MAAEHDNKNMPKLEASIHTTDDPLIIINHDNINPPHHQQQPSNYFGPGPAPAGNTNAAAAFVSFNNGGHPPQVDVPPPPPPPPVVAAPAVAAADDQDDREYFASFPPGYRFCPLDRELILHYLYRKVHDLPLPRNQIREVNLYRNSPDTITERYPSIGENQWYFFTPRDKKYLNGSRPNRAAGNGFWKATGADKPIYDGRSQKPIGCRKALVYYEGKPPKGKKTNWIMHEFRLHLDTKESSVKNKHKKRPANDMRLDDFILCKLYKKIDKSLKSRSASDDSTAAIEEVEGEGGEEVANGENGFHVPNFAPSHSQENFHPSYVHENHIRLHPSHSHNELPYSLPIPIPPPLQSSLQNDYHYFSQSELLPNLLSFRCQPAPYFHQQHHYSVPVSNSQVFISKSNMNMVDMKTDMEYTCEYDYHPNDNSLGEYFIDGEFDNAIPVNAESLDDSYIDSSSSQQKNSFDST